MIVLRSCDPSWDEWIEGVPRDVYHLAGYHLFAAGSGEGEPFMVVVGDRTRGLAWPYILRRVDRLEGLKGCSATDVTSVYGYPGPIAWGLQPDDAFLSAAWAEIVATWRDQKAIAAFTRFHPLLGNASLASAFGNPADRPLEAGEAAICIGRTVSIDCTLDEKCALASYPKVLRQEIAASRRAGLATTHDTDWRDLPEFIRVYRATMLRSGAGSRYDVDEDDVCRLRACLGPHLHLLVARMDGEVAAAGLFTEFDGIVQAHLAGTDDQQRARSPLKVLLDDARQWARDRGASALHLGGGRGSREDALFAFKSRFSPRRHPFSVGRWVLDADAYQELTEARAAVAGPLTGPFFPAYRRESDDSASGERLPSR